MKTTLVAISIAAFCLPTIAASAAQTYECGMETYLGRGFVQERIQFVIDDERSSATVFVPLISSLYGAPIKAKMTKKRDGRY